MKILIENYSMKLEIFKVDHQEIIDFTPSEIVELMSSISEHSENPVKIITEDYIITKLTSEDFECKFNRKQLNFFSYGPFAKIYNIKEIPIILQKKLEIKSYNLIKLTIDCS